MFEEIKEGDIHVMSRHDILPLLKNGLGWVKYLKNDRPNGGGLHSYECVVKNT